MKTSISIGEFDLFVVPTAIFSYEKSGLQGVTGACCKVARRLNSSARPIFRGKTREIRMKVGRFNGKISREIL
jgi:hypothetical protein